MKKLLKLSIISLAAIITLTGCGCSKDEKKDEVKKEDSGFTENTNENVVKDQEIAGLKFTNTKLVYKEGSSVLTVDVTNTTNEDYSLGDFYVVAKDKNGKEMIRLLAYAGEVIPAGGTSTVNAGTDMNLSKAYSIEYEEVKK